MIRCLVEFWADGHRVFAEDDKNDRSLLVAACDSAGEAKGLAEQLNVVLKEMCGE